VTWNGNIFDGNYLDSYNARYNRAFFCSEFCLGIFRLILRNIEFVDTFVSASSNKIEAAANDETHHFVMVYIRDGSFIYALSVMHRIEGICTKFLKFAELWLKRNSFFIFNQNSIK